MQFTGPAMLRVDGELALILRARPLSGKSTAGYDALHYNNYYYVTTPPAAAAGAGAPAPPRAPASAARTACSWR